MQLSFLEEIPETTKKIFLDVFAEAQFDVKTEKMKLRTINGQHVPEDMKIAIPSKYISKYPEGTIFKLDSKLVSKTGKKPYFSALNAKKVQRAIEYFQYNLKIQYGFDFSFSKRRTA